MENITANGRMEFIKSKKPDGCVFCKDSIRDDGLVLFENRDAFIMMNKYPYNTGHILIAPQRHVAQIEEMTTSERMNMIDLMEATTRALKKAMNPEGFNTGMNIGKAGGAGIVDHLHLHIVPRWDGDTNFMTCIAETRVTPENVVITYRHLKSFFEDAGFMAPLKA